MTPTDIPSFAATQLSLLDAELKAELAETATLASQSSPTALQRAGAAILNLRVSSQRTGFGGKTVVELELDPAVGGGDIPEHGMRVGDIVGVEEQPAGWGRKREKGEMRKRGIEGVVLKVTNAAVSVALDKEDADVPGGKLWLWVLSCGGQRSTCGCGCELIDYVESSLQMMSRIRGVFEYCVCVRL